MIGATYDTLILSDILLDDIFSDLNFRRLTSEHWKFLSCIRKLSNPKRQVEVVWVEGNHDTGLAKLMSHLVGVPVYQRYVWEYEGKRHLAMHGHQFDGFVKKNLWISRVGELIFLQIQKVDSRTKCVSRFLDRMNTRWLLTAAARFFGARSKITKSASPACPRRRIYRSQ